MVWPAFYRQLKLDEMGSVRYRQMKVGAGNQDRPRESVPVQTCWAVCCSTARLWPREGGDDQWCTTTMGC